MGLPGSTGTSTWGLGPDPAVASGVPECVGDEPQAKAPLRAKAAKKRLGTDERSFPDAGMRAEQELCNLHALLNGKELRFWHLK